MKYKNVVLLICALLISGCASTLKFDKAKLKKVKKVGIVIFTVPESIKYKSDPKAGKESELSAVVKIVARKMSEGDGVKAATLSMRTFIKELNKSKLPFKVISRKEMLKRKSFKGLYSPPAPKKKAKGALGMLASFGSPNMSVGVGPKGINSYGLQSNWSGGDALIGSDSEMEYIKKAIKALKVDAALVINDKGYSFSCNACAGAGGVMNGSASTGSAFTVTMVDKKGGPIMQLREWFGSTSSNAMMVSNIVNPLEHEKLFKVHGQKMGKLFARMFKEKMAEKK